MSVINQMLEDLEKRRSSNKQTNLLPDMDPETSLEAEGVSYSRVIKILLISGVVAFLGVALYKYSGVFRSNKVISTPVTKTQAPLVTSPPLVATVPPKTLKNLLTQVSLTHAAASTRLKLKFSRSVHYEVQDKLDLGSWAVFFDNTEISSAVTPVTVTNTLIKTFEMHPDSHKLQLKLTFLKPTHVQSMLLDHENDAEFLIEIEPRQENAESQREQLPPELEEVVPSMPPVSVQTHSLQIPLPDGEGRVFLDKMPKKGPVKIKRVLTREEKAEELFQEGLSFVEKEQYEKARDKLKESLSVWPDHHLAREVSIKLSIRLGRLLEAEQDLNEGMMHASLHLPFIKLKARLLVEEKQQKRALMLLRLHEKLGTSDPEYLNFMATLYRETGETAHAISLYQQALRRESHNWRGRIGLAIALEESGYLDQALEAYKMVQTNSEVDDESRKFVGNRVRVLGKR